nr:MAG TPA: Tail tube protein [Caudoviricetes sp.]
MSYQKQNFANGEVLTAAQLNHMEDGIAKANENTNFGSGLSEASKTLLLSLLENAAYTSPSMQAQLNALRTEWSSSGGGSGGSGEIPVQSVSLSSSALTLNEGESKTLTATVLPADATNKSVIWTVTPTGIATVVNGTVTASKAGSCTVTAMAGGKSASCTVTVEAAETAQLIYTLPAETELTNGFDTGLKLLEHASTELPQYTILVDAKAGDNFDASTWPAFLHCLTETGSTANLPGFNSTSSPLNNKTEFAYYNYGGVTLSDSIEHLKTRTRYVVQLDGNKYRGGSTYCPMTEWLTSNGTITDVPQTFLIGAAQSADGSKKQQFWPGTLYQCKVYKGLLSDEKVNEFINSSGSDSGSDKIPVQSVSLSSSALTLNEGESKTLTATVLPAAATNKSGIWTVPPSRLATGGQGAPER